MKISQEPISAFAIYSEKLKQKKKKKSFSNNGVSKLSGKKKVPNNDLKLCQMKEIGDLLKKLSGKSNLDLNLTEDFNNYYNNVSDDETCFKDKNKVVKRGGSSNITDIQGPKRKTNFKTEPSCKSKKFEKSNKRYDDADQQKMKEINATKDNTTGTFEVSETNTDLLQTVTFTKIKQNKNKMLENKKVNMSQNGKFKSTSQKKVPINPNNFPVQISNNKNVISPKKSNIKEKNDKKRTKTQTIQDWTNQENSILAAKRLFEWLIQPMPEKDFMRNYWEKKPLLIQRESNRNYYSELLSTPVIDTVLRKNNIQFTKHLDITSYTEKGRETHNLSGRAQANVVWDFYSNGCSVRMLNPQQFVPKIHTLNATLQEYFGCFVGANVYLTPQNSQGFAPHYDDIEAFVLQIEGKKLWKVYKPRNDGETLPRFSSPNFSQDEIGEPFLDVVLEPGDMLYFPRGFIHQACTVEGEHSLHITLSAFQKTAWVDLLEKALPLALKRAAAEDTDFRRGLPRDYLGIEFHGSEAEKASFVGTAQRLMAKLGHYLNLSLGAGVDQMGAQFMHDALPPVFTQEENKNSGLGGGLKMKENGKLVDRVEFEMDTQVKLIRGNVCRLVEEENEVRLYHCLDNSLEYHAEVPQFLELPPEGVRIVTFLATNYPSYVKIKSIPHEDEDALLTLISDIWDAGLLVTRGLQTVSESE